MSPSSRPSDSTLRDEGESSEIRLLLDKHIVAAGVAPGATAAIAAQTARGWRVLQGSAGSHSPSDPRPVSAGTIYDLASVTKPIFAVSAVRYLRESAISLETPLAKLLPLARGTHAGDAPLSLLLSHRAGLEAHLELFAPIRDGISTEVDRESALLEAAHARRPECSGRLPREGFAPIYSDLGYILVGEALKHIAAIPVDELIRRQTTQPLRVALMSSQQWNHALRPHAGTPRQDAGSHPTFAPSETVDWRGGELRGIVHDDNCWVLAGAGCQGHAGLFGQVEGVCRFGCALLDALGGSDEWLGKDLISAMLQPRPGGDLRMGFDGKSRESSSAGSRFGAHAFGHLGFTGTSLWCDPDPGIVVALLTNRVCPSRDNLRIRSARPTVHDGLFELADILRQRPTR